VSLITSDDLTSLLLKEPTFSAEGAALKLREVMVPLLAPTSQEQAQQWTLQYWPTIYRKTNPFGPHPATVARAKEELEAGQGVKVFMDMAREAAAESQKQGLGLGAACVVVERREGTEENIVAVAGDARYKGLSCCRDGHEGPDNIAAHAVLRAIGMIARKRVRVAAPRTNGSTGAQSRLLVTPVSHSGGSPESITESLLDYPLNQRETDAFEKDNIVPNGYLCVDLEIYLTHEPCLMCSMAIVHSRFGRCIFSQRMPRSGGMAADGGLGYGLFWRTELNWKLLGWEWEDESQRELKDLDDDVQV